MHSFDLVYLFLPRPLEGGQLMRATSRTAEAQWPAAEPGRLVGELRYRI